jgi:hypothetical protein
VVSLSLLSFVVGSALSIPILFQAALLARVATMILLKGCITRGASVQLIIIFVIVRVPAFSLSPSSLVHRGSGCAVILHGRPIENG